MLEGKQKEAIETIRAITGIITPGTATNRCALACLLARYVLGDAEESFVKETMNKVGIDIFSEKNVDTSEKEAEDEKEITKEG